MISHRLSPNHPPPNVHCACRHFAAETEKLSKQPGGGGRDDDFDFGSMGAGKGEDGDAGVGDDAGMSESPADDADAPVCKTRVSVYGRAASRGALAPQPPRATRVTFVFGAIYIYIYIFNCAEKGGSRWKKKIDDGPKKNGKKCRRTKMRKKISHPTKISMNLAAHSRNAKYLDGALKQKKRT